MPLSESETEAPLLPLLEGKQGTCQPAPLQSLCRLFTREQTASSDQPLCRGLGIESPGEGIFLRYETAGTRIRSSLRCLLQCFQVIARCRIFPSCLRPGYSVTDPRALLLIDAKDFRMDSQDLDPNVRMPVQSQDRLPTALPRMISIQSVRAARRANPSSRRQRKAFAGGEPGAASFLLLSPFESGLDLHSCKSSSLPDFGFGCP